jgi:hypothetical protein
MEKAGKKSTGRPSQTVTRENSIGIRLTKSERFIIYQKARRTGMNLSTYIRQMAISGKVIARLNEEDRQLVRQLIQMSGDIHQLVVTAQEAGMLKATMHYEALRNKIDKLIDQFNHDK